MMNGQIELGMLQAGHVLELDAARCGTVSPRRPIEREGRDSDSMPHNGGAA